MDVERPVWIERVHKGESFDQADLADVVMRRCRFVECSFRGARLNDIDTAGCLFMEKADLRSSDLTRAQLGQARLFGADLRGAIMEGVDWKGLDGRGAIIDVGQAVLLARSLGARVE